jgi:transcriptional accessory protein Tex/SPT6
MPEQSSRSIESRWQQLVELRSRREIVQRWLQTANVPEALRDQLRIQLQEIELKLTAMESPRRPAPGRRLREAV